MKYIAIIDSDNELSEDAIKELKETLFIGDEKAPYCFDITSIEKAPKPMQISQRQGHWIHELEDWNKWTCSECGWNKRTDVHVKLGYKYCPNCGAKMESEVNNEKAYNF